MVLKVDGEVQAERPTETTTEPVKLDSRAAIERTLRVELEREKMLVDSLGEKTTDSPTPYNIKGYQTALKNHIINMERYAKMKGWLNEKLPVERRKERASRLKEIFSDDDAGTDGIIKAEVDDA